MDIFIKSFRRPFALDRCLSSIRTFVRNPGRIVILDDGSELAHLARIVERYPGLEIRRSKGALIKTAFINRVFDHWRANLGSDHADTDYSKMRMILPPELDPSAFWVAEIERDASRHFLLLEDDCFFTRPFDLAHAAQCMTERRAIFLRLFWLGSDFFSCRALAKPGSAMAGEPVIEEYVPPENAEGAALYFQVALAAFDRDYWITAQRAGVNWVMEEEKFAAAHTYWTSHAGANTLLRATEECIGHGFSTSCTVRGPDVVDGFNVFRVNDALADAWMTGDLPQASLGSDWAPDLMADIIERRIDTDYAAKWRKWRRDILDFQRGLNLGFKLPD